jgi:hypothetical protein
LAQGSRTQLENTSLSGADFDSGQGKARYKLSKGTKSEALFNLQKQVQHFDVEPSRSRLSLKLARRRVLRRCGQLAVDVLIWRSNASSGLPKCAAGNRSS